MPNAMFDERRGGGDLRTSQVQDPTGNPGRFQRRDCQDLLHQFLKTCGKTA